MAYEPLGLQRTYDLLLGLRHIYDPRRLSPWAVAHS
jgi:hypothetical protein